jgi:predicted helicase
MSEHLDPLNHLYVAPTIKLLYQSKDEFDKVGYLRLYPELICSDDHEQTIKAIMAKLKHAPCALRP